MRMNLLPSGRRRRAALLALLLPLAAAGTAPRGSMRAAIRAAMAAQTRAWNRGDILGFMRGYRRSPQTEFVGPQGIEHGWQALAERYRREYPNRAAMGRLRFKILRILRLGKRAALVTGEYRLARRGRVLRGAFTLVWRKFANGWKIIDDHTSPYAGAAAR